MADRADLTEIGVSGIQRVGGIIQDEILPELRYPKRNQIIRQMVANDATIGALLFAIEMLVRQVEWHFDPASEAPEDVAARDFVAECFDDMSQSWADTLSDVLSFLPWGWSYHEVVYKLRQGDSNDPTRRSKYDDGKIGWRKWPIRSQETLYEWLFDDSGGIQAMVQMAPPDYRTRTIPIDRALLFRTKPNRASPEGWSILRNAYRSWRLKTRIENLEGIGIERDLAGLPVAYIPAEYMSPDATAAQKATLAAVQDIVTNIRNDEQAGIVMPMTRDDKGNKNFDLALISSGGARQFNINDTVARYDQRILMSVMADFLMLGAGPTGSLALSSDKTDLFGTAIGAYLDSIAGVVNVHATPRLMRMNGNAAGVPLLRHGDIESEDIEQVADFVSKLMASGAISASPELERALLKMAALPAPAEEA